MVAELAKEKSKGGRPRLDPIERLSERRLVRLDPTLDAVVAVLRKEKARLANVPVEAIRVQDVIRELLMDGAEARKLVSPAAAKEWRQRHLEA